MLEIKREAGEAAHFSAHEEKAHKFRGYWNKKTPDSFFYNKPNGYIVFEHDKRKFEVPVVFENAIISKKGTLTFTIKLLESRCLTSKKCTHKTSHEKPLSSQTLLERYGGKPMKMHFFVDSQIIGGGGGHIG